jgi:hypothetical protein
MNQDDNEIGGDIEIGAVGNVAAAAAAAAAAAIDGTKKLLMQLWNLKTMIRKAWEFIGKIAARIIKTVKSAL